MKWEVTEGSIEPTSVMDEGYWEYVAKLDTDYLRADQITFRIMYIPSMKKIFLSFNFNEAWSKKLLSFLNEVGEDGACWSIENVNFNSEKELYDFAYGLAELLVEEQECWGERNLI